MKRFDRSIKVLQDEIDRHIGKVTVKLHERGQNTSLALHEARASELKEAIKILQDHPRNNHV